MFRQAVTSNLELFLVVSAIGFGAMVVVLVYMAQATSVSILVPLSLAFFAYAGGLAGCIYVVSTGSFQVYSSTEALFMVRSLWVTAGLTWLGALVASAERLLQVTRARK